MRYAADLAARATAWLALPTEQKRGGDGSGLVELGAIWAAIQGLPTAPACRQCQYSDRVHDLTAYLREYARFTLNSSAMSDNQSQYQFQPAYAGQTLTSDDYGKAVTADNLTDEDAEFFIAKGFGHIFQKIGAALEGAGAKLEKVGEGLAGDEDKDELTEREQELQAQYEQAEEAYTKEVTSHAQTVEQLHSVGLAKEQAEASLASEQQAHEATAAKLTATTTQLGEVQQQLSAAQAQIADLQAALAAATAPKAKKASAAPVADSTQGDSSDAATGSN